MHTGSAAHLRGPSGLRRCAHEESCLPLDGGIDMKKYSAALFMLGLGILCLAVHFWLGWQAYISEQQDHQASATLSSYVVEWGRDVFENLQSEFLQLFFQFM